MDNSTDIVFGQLFEWSGITTTAESYQIQFSDDSNFTIIVASDSALSNSVRTIPDILMQPLNTFFWRVRGINESGPGAWSDAWSFTTAEFFTQQINMKIGWNLISSNILPNNDSLEKMFNLINDKILIVKNYAGGVYIPEYNINTIGKWNKLDGYKIYCNQVSSLNVVGYLIDPSQTNYNLKQGWNQISYIRSTPMDAAVAFKSLVDSGVLLIVKDETGKSYIPDYNINTIGNLVPGKAYILFLTSASQFNYPPNN